MSTHERKKKDFLRAYDAYADALFRHCFFRVHDRGLAENLVQEAYMKTWDYIIERETPKNLRAFLYKVLTNLVIDEFRKKKPISLEMLLDEGLEFVDSATASSEKKAELKEVLKFIHGLEEQYREVLIMKFVDGLSLKEIAEILGEAQNTVSVRIHRGIKKLKKAF